MVYLPPNGGKEYTTPFHEQLDKLNDYFKRGAIGSTSKDGEEKRNKIDELSGKLKVRLDNVNVETNKKMNATEKFDASKAILTEFIKKVGHPQDKANPAVTIDRAMEESRLSEAQRRDTENQDG